METDEYVTLNYPERYLFSDITTSLKWIQINCDSILEHDASTHDLLKNSYNRNQMNAECEELIRHFTVLSEEVDKIKEFKKEYLEVKS